MFRIFLLASFLLFFNLHAEEGTVSAGSRAERIKLLLEGLKTPALRMAGVVDKMEGKPGIRDLTEAALTLMLLKESPTKAEALVKLAFAQQNKDEKSPAFGTVPWQVGVDDIKDPNAIEFMLQPLGPLCILYGDSFSKGFKNEIKPGLQAAFVALKNHRVNVAYTNIFLMKSINYILLGEWLGDDKAAETGYKMIDEWCEFTSKNGIHEFASPTYYACDLESLGVAYLLCKRPQYKTRFKSILDLFWTEISARYFPPRESLSGAFSRDYDFLQGRGGMGRYLFVEGFATEALGSNPGLSFAISIVGMGENGYQIPDSIRKIQDISERAVQQRWGEKPGMDAYTFVTSNFSLGSASEVYGPQDKLLSLEMKSAQRNGPVLQVLEDAYDAPYGKVKLTGRDGHAKPIRLPLGPTIVQHRDTLLALLQPNALKEERTSLATNLVFPLRADRILLNGKELEMSKETTLEVVPDSVLALRYGAVGVAIRIFAATGFGDFQPKWVLKCDAAGLKAGVGRWAIYQYQGAAKVIEDGNAHTGLALQVDTCLDNDALLALSNRMKNVKLEQNADEKKWKVKATWPSLVLECERDLAGRKTALRKVNGESYNPPVLSVNDKEVEVLKELKGK